MGRILVGLCTIEEDVTENDSNESEKTSDDDGEKYQARLLDRKLIHLSKRIRYSREEAKERSKLGRNVKTDESSDGLEEEHPNRSHDSHDGKGLEASRQWRRGLNLETHLLGELALDCWVEGFLREGCEDHGEDGEEDESPLRPAPAFAVDDE